MSQHLLETTIEEPLNNEINELRSRIVSLERENVRLRQECMDAAHKAVASLLKQMFTPLHAATSTLIGDKQAQASAVDTRTSAVWESWKQKLGGKKAEVIQALWEHGEMNVAQLRVATHSGQQTVYDVTSALFRLGLLNKNGGKYSLKEMR